MKWDSKPVRVNEYGRRSGRSTEGLPFVELTDTVQWGTPFQEFLGDGEHPLAFSVDSFDIVLMSVKGFEYTSRYSFR